MKQKLFLNKNFKHDHKTDFDTDKSNLLIDKALREINFEKKLIFKKTTNFGKTRTIAFFNKKSFEMACSKHIAQVLKMSAKLPKKNMHKLMDEFLSSLKKIENVNQFTVVMFDFKNFYNSISSEYAYNYALKKLKISNTNKKLIKKFCKEVKYCFAGIASSNIIGEIMAQCFEDKLEKNLKDFKVLTMVRYGDDFVVVLNKQHNEENIKKIILKTLETVFFSRKIKHKHKNKTKVHLSGAKFAFVKRDNLPLRFDYFGYEVELFENENKVDFKLGVSEKLRNLYLQNLKNLVLKNYSNVEVLRNLILVNSKRFAYTKQSINKKNKIVSINYIQNKKLLRKYLNKISPETKRFYQSAIINTFNNLGLSLPYYLKDNNKSSGYNLWANLIKNKTILLDEKIGLGEDAQKKLLMNINEEKKCQNDNLLQEQILSFVITKK